MSVQECLKHEWLALDTIDGQVMKRLSTDKLKTFIARRKWQVRYIHTYPNLTLSKNASSN